MKQLLYKTIYQKQINSILRKINKALFPKMVHLSPSGVISFDTPNSPLVMHTNQTSYITQFIFWKGYSNFEYTPIFEKLIKEVTEFYDIGANIGYYSLLAVAANPNIKVVAFEPSNGAWHYLNKNIAANHFNAQIKAEKLALMDSTGQTEFYEVQNIKYPYLKHNLSGEAGVTGEGTKTDFVKYRVDCDTLDNYIQQHGVNNIDLIKVDTEGCEDMILANAKNAINRFQPIIICETLFGVIEDKLDQIMKEHHYRFFNHVGDKLVEVSSIKREKDNDVRNCFFVPESKLALIQQFL